MIIFGIWWWGSAGGVCVCIREGGVYVQARQSSALFWYLSKISRFFVLCKTRPMPSDRVSAWAGVCVWACLKMWGSTNAWLLPVVCTDMVSVGRVHRRIKQHCYGILGGMWKHTEKPGIKQRPNCKNSNEGRDRFSSPMAGCLVPEHAAMFHLWFLRWSNGNVDRIWLLGWNMPEMTQILWMILMACW